MQPGNSLYGSKTTVIQKIIVPSKADFQNRSGPVTKASLCLRKSILFSKELGILTTSSTITIMGICYLGMSGPEIGSFWLVFILFLSQRLANGITFLQRLSRFLISSSQRLTKGLLTPIPRYLFIQHLKKREVLLLTPVIFFILITVLLS